MAELFYFPDNGKGEAIRLALDVAGIPYTEHTISHSEWPELRKKGLASGSLPFGQVPLLKIDGMNVVQSTAILRYISRNYISPNADNKMETTIDMMIEGWNDIINGYFNNLFGETGVLNSWLYSECDVILSRLEACYIRNATKYFISDEVTVVDCIAIATIENLMFDMPDVLLNHKGLTEYMQNAISHEAIRKSLKSRDKYIVSSTNIQNTKILRLRVVLF